MWLSRDGLDPAATSATMRGFRHGVRGPYTHNPDFLLADPRHLAPSRPPRVDGELWADPDGLHLSESAGIVIADTTYGNVVVSGESTGSLLPTVDLGGFLVGPPEPCPWPQPGTRFTVTRSGKTVLAAVDDKPARSCPGPEGRVAIGLRGLGASSSP